MNCPYCSGEMRPDSTVIYPGPGGMRVAEWVRCVRCRHATIRRMRPMFEHHAAVRSLELAASA